MEKFTLERIKEYYSQPKRIIPDGDGYLLHRILADYIVSLDPDHVFEFGCNRGLNLNNIAKRNTDIDTRGCDINATAVEIANGFHDVLVADETYFDLRPPIADVYFTCSVLNHLPNGLTIVEKMQKATSKYVVLMEAIEIPDHPRWWKHDYESLGFTLHTTIKSEQGNCTYGLFSWHRNPLIN